MEIRMEIREIEYKDNRKKKSMETNAGSSKSSLINVVSLQST